MLKQFAPNASTPPSPKKSAWIARATLTATTAAHGPRSIAISTAPTACAVVPSGIGTLNIITKKLYAAPSARSGTDRLVTTLRTRFPAVVHTGTIAAAMTPHVSGDRYPSGMCTAVPPVYAPRSSHERNHMPTARMCKVFAPGRIAGFRNVDGFQ